MTRTEIEHLILAGGVRLVWDHNGPPQLSPTTPAPLRAYTCVEGRDVVMHIWREWFDNLPDAYQSEVLAHELAHIVRGDIVAMATGKKPMPWNAASDCMINQSLPYIREHEHDSLVYERVRDAAPDRDSWPHPNALPPTEWLYRKFLVAGNPLCSRGGGNRSCDQDRAPTASPQEAAAATAEVVARVREAVKSGQISGDWVEKHLTGRTASPTGGFDPVRRIDPRWITTAELEARVRRALRRSHVSGHSRAPQRTYRRRHGVFPLRIPMPTATVVLAVDVSASLTEWYPHLAHVEQRLAAQYEVVMYHWSTTVQRVTSHAAASKPWGGGTDIRPMLRALPRATSVLVICTDYETTPPVETEWLPRCPVIWAIVGPRQPRLRPGDSMVRLQGVDHVSAP